MLILLSLFVFSRLSASGAGAQKTKLAAAVGTNALLFSIGRVPDYLGAEKLFIGAFYVFKLSTAGKGSGGNALNARGDFDLLQAFAAGKGFFLNFFKPLR